MQILLEALQVISMGKAIFSLSIPIITKIIRGQTNIVKGFEQQVSPIGCNIAQLVKMSDIANTEVLNKEGKKFWQSYS